MEEKGMGYPFSMPDMEDLEKDAEKEAKDHPDDVKKGEQDVEKEFEK
jgi:hypothetical protein